VSQAVELRDVWMSFPGKAEGELAVGEVIRIETPGGAGHGSQ